MNRKLFFLFGAILLALFLYFDSYARQNFVRYALGIKSFLLHAKNSTEFKISTFFEQSKKIESLQQQINELQRYKILYKDLEFKYRSLLQSLPVTFKDKDIQMSLTRMISYVKLGDFSSAWLDAKLSKGKIVGLVSNGEVIGIAVGRVDSTIAYFNGNPKCSYTVTIGQGTKGIVTGKSERGYVQVKYIPSFASFSKGDKVITNGFDGIFPYGIPVGEVVEYWQEGSYKVAKVKIYQKTKEPLFFWLIDRKSNKVIK